MGTYECDDGNNNDGDGCSAHCKIEDGFECKHEGNGADVCKDIVKPKASLLFVKNTIMLIIFDEIVTIKVNSENLENSMKISLDKNDGDLNWKLITKFSRNKRLKELKIEMKPEY